MIRVERGAEPEELPPIRNRELHSLRALNNPSSEDIPKTYRVVAEALWKQQFLKCCYCEKVVQQRYNDVEHYRPKARANRVPGCSRTHGYWWLAYTWENLIFACPNCNRSEKNDEFPLDAGSVSLMAEELTPGHEQPLLIDPASDVNPVEHIEFLFVAQFDGGPKHWWAQPRNGSALGSHTIRVCGLNRGELRELRTQYVANYVQPQIEQLKIELTAHDVVRANHAFCRALEMTSPRFEFAALTYDAFRAGLPHDELNRLLGVSLPTPSLACR